MTADQLLGARMFGDIGFDTGPLPHIVEQVIRGWRDLQTGRAPARLGPIQTPAN